VQNLTNLTKEVGVKKGNLPQQSAPSRNRSHMPDNSLFFEKVVPALLVLMGIVLVGLVLFAAGVIFGIIHF
jgi:hypothetical protein